MRPQGAKMRQGDSKIKNSTKLKEKAKLSTGNFVNSFAFPFKAEFGNRPLTDQFVFRSIPYQPI